jgi:DNA-binding NtrC family response regulator
MSVLKSLIQQHEKTIIERYLNDNEGNRSRTAEALGISRRGLLNKLKAYGLIAEKERHDAQQSE